MTNGCCVSLMLFGCISRMLGSFRGLASVFFRCGVSRSLWIAIMLSACCRSCTALWKASAA